MASDNNNNTIPEATKFQSFSAKEEGKEEFGKGNKQELLAYIK